MQQAHQSSTFHPQRVGSERRLETYQNSNSLLPRDPPRATVAALLFRGWGLGVDNSYLAEM